MTSTTTTSTTTTTTVAAIRELASNSKAGAFVFADDDYGNETFEAETTAYWSTECQERLPLAVFLPASAKELGKVLPALSQLPCGLAIKSGGHMPSPSSNTAHNGVLISLARLRTFGLDQDSGIANVGSGFRWGEVYERLQPFGRTAVGGRYKDVGVGGFLLGGGMSHLSNQYGLGVDNVVNMEVVLASGEVVSANSSENPDLFWALKGGSNNFGIVTRFDLQTIEQGTIWGGMHVVPADSLPQLLTLLDSFQAHGQANDPSAALVASFIQGRSIGATTTAQRMCSTMLYHGSATTAAPPALHDIATLPAVHSTLRPATHLELCVELARQNSNSERHKFLVGAVKAAPNASQLVYDMYFGLAENHALYDRVRYTALTLLPVSRSMLARTDGPYASARTDGPVIWWTVHLEYEDPAADAPLQTFCDEVYTAIQQAAREKGLASDFLYINDAAEGQDVMRSYGEEAWRRLKDVSARYDPGSLFQKKVGGFKLGVAA